MNSKYLKITSFLSVLAITTLLFFSGTANAFTPNYNSSNLIDDGTFLNNSTMSASDIQAFLQNVGSGLATYSDVEACTSATAPLYTHCGQTISAAQIIYDSSQAYSINPRDIIATLEKEQSLITNPTPTSSEINCAMGYNSCSGVVGFFNQVDAGAWQFRADMDLMQGISYWGYSPSQYPCASASANYSTGLYPGNTVTFYDSGGTPETITLANAATATLYCYTPYVGPVSVTGYSGSYNFVYYFQLWFGSTASSSPYAWAYEGQSTYSDSAYSNPLTGTPTVAPGGIIYAQVVARNIGYDSWEQSSLHLGTDNPEDRSSVFYDTTWINQQRPSGMIESTVAPGSDAIFNFVLHAPTQTGTYREYFNLVDDGVTWLNDPGLYYKINVVAPITTSSNATILSSGQSLSINNYLLSPEKQSALDFQSNGNITLYNNFQQSWSTNTGGSGGDILYMQTDGNLVEYNSSGTAVWASNTSNNPGAYLALQIDGNLVIYSSGGTALWATGTVQNPNNLDYVNTYVNEGAILFGGQSLQTASRIYTLVMQGDGNLVEYTNTGDVVWDSGTQNNPGAYLALQTDGNLVIYSASGQALWASYIFGNNNELKLSSTGQLTINSSSTILLPGQKLQPNQEIETANHGLVLVMQGDGNLVEYTNTGDVVWDSGTQNNPGAYLALQTDGNLVIYSASNVPLWDSGTQNNPGAYLALQTDGNLVIYDHGTNNPVWATYNF